MVSLRYRQNVGQLLLFGVLVLVALAPNAIAGGGTFDGEVDSDSAHIAGLSPSHLAELASRVRGAATAPSGFSGPWSRYSATSYCTTLLPGKGESDFFCGKAVAACAHGVTGQSDGPAVWVWRSYVDADDKPVTADGAPLTDPQWENMGFTCYPRLVPGAGPTLTLSDVQWAFHDTKFAVPELSIQPRKGRTLVNLRTFSR